MPVAEPAFPIGEAELCVLARHPSARAARERWIVFATLCALSLTLAAGFMAAGAWPVLPYSLLELAVLAGAFWHMQRRAGDWERLTVAGDRVIVERHERGRFDRREWNRPWVSVGQTQQAGTYRQAVQLRCAGECWNFGGTLSRPEREALARDLRRLVGHAGPYARGTGAPGEGIQER